MGKDVLRSGELPQNLRILVVDDVPAILKQNITALQTGLSVDVAQLELTPINNFSDLINHALDQKPEIIVLDDNYENFYKIWKPTNAVLEPLAQKYGVNFEPIKDPEELKPPAELYEADSINYSRFLRYFGYKGKIIVSSNNPPPWNLIEKSLNRFNDLINKFDVVPLTPPLINGVIHKRFDYGPQNLSTFSNQEKQLLDISYPEALNNLIKQL